MTTQWLPTHSTSRTTLQTREGQAGGLRLISLLCLALLLAPGALATDQVSRNVVGYVQLSVPAGGQSLIANPLNGVNNNLTTILPLPATAQNVSITRWNYATQGFLAPIIYDPASGWEADPAINPGEAFFLANHDLSPLNLIFVGQVPEGTLTVSLPSSGQSYVASMVPQARLLGMSGQAGTLQFPTQSGDEVDLWNGATFVRYVTDPFSSPPVWAPAEPSIGVAQGFVFSRSDSGSDWTRNFVVSSPDGPGLTIALQPDWRVKVSWAAPSDWLLQSATDPEGPWTFVSGQTSPYTFVADSPKKFFRLLECPPFSSNVVGYVQLTVPAGGRSLIANPLNGVNNNLSTILPLPASATDVTLYRWNYAEQAFFTPISYVDHASGWDADPVINPGEGFFMQNDGHGPLNLVFVGQVSEGSLTVPVPSGSSYVASMVPQARPLGESSQGGTLQFPTQPGDSASLWDASRRLLVSYNCDLFDGTWSPSEPQIGVAQGFIYKNNSPSTSWVRNFVVSDPAGPGLAVALQPDWRVKVSWTAPSNWVLESSADPEGGWVPLPYQTSPYTFVPDAPYKFFRLANPALWCSLTSSNTYLVSWRNAGYKLQKRPTSAPTWSDVPTAPGLVGGEYQVSLDDLVGWVTESYTNGNPSVNLFVTTGVGWSRTNSFAPAGCTWRFNPTNEPAFFRLRLQ